MNKKVKQLNIFGEEAEQKKETQKNNATNNNLFVLKQSKNDNKQEAKQKKLISFRIKKINELEKLIESDYAVLQKIKSLFQKNLSQETNEVNEQKEVLVRKLIKRYEQKSFANWHREIMEKLIEENINDLIADEYERDIIEDLKKTYEELYEAYNFGNEEDDWDDDDWDEDLTDEEKASLDKEMDDIAKELEKNLIIEKLEEMGLEVDDDFFEGLDFSADDFRERLQERIFEFHRKEEEQKSSKKKKEKVLTTDKEFTKLYKNLAKKIHPDLTTDEEERKRREILMQELSAIWERRDYYELLAIQYKIDPEFQSEVNLNETHLKQIAEDLLEKVNELEEQRHELKYHPENRFYFFNFHAKSEKGIMNKLNGYKSFLNEEKKKLEENTKRLDNQKNTKEYLKEIYEDIYDDYLF